MLSVSEETIRAQNLKANLGLYGQEYNDESWAICCADMLIKDEERGGSVFRYSVPVPIGGVAAG
jgi:type I restriction-modification system DNA methylase subunit